MLKLTTYCASLFACTFALLHDGRAAINQSPLSLVGGAPAPCYVQGTANCPDPDTSSSCTAVDCIQDPLYPKDETAQICTPHKDPTKIYVQQEQVIDTYYMAQATKTKSGKKDFRFSKGEVKCVIDRACNTCKSDGFFDPYTCRADGNEVAIKETRTATFPSGDDCQPPTPKR